MTGGENVYPREVEDALEQVPGVASACVFGVPDDRWGQRVAAALVLSRDTHEAEILRALRPQLASFKMPRLWARVPALPVGVTGKLDRRAAAIFAQPLLAAYLPVGPGGG